MKNLNGNIMKEMRSNGMAELNLQFTDIHGSAKSAIIPARNVGEALDKGVWFDGSSIEGFTRICESDMFLKADPSTYSVNPWDRKSARVICDVYTPEGKPFEGDPRNVLKRVMKEASGLDLEYMVGPELEFFLFKTDGYAKPSPMPHDSASYFDLSPKDLATEVRRDMISTLHEMGIVCEMGHHEVAPGQHEIDLKYGNALRIADSIVTVRHTIKLIAQKYGLHATFMPKPIFGENGSGMHVHQSLFRNGKNVFFDPRNRYKLSKTAYSFIAGQLKHVKAMSAVVAPTINSYKRLVPGYEAPVYICWAQINRSALIRIPRYSRGREQSTRAELRCPDPSTNPYLAFAVMLKAGLDGIKQNLSPPEPVEENVYEFDDSKLDQRNIGRLPASLWEALDELKKDKTMQDALGPHLFQTYLDAKRKEWYDYIIQVTDWEKKKYFEKL
jgi:glutamine synthetase